MADTEKRTTRLGFALIFAAGVSGLAATGAFAQMHGMGMGNGMHGQSGGGMHGHGAGGGGHDMVGMPGLRGLDATPQESAELGVMFNNFDLITRTVTNLPNGISTLTHSPNEELMEIVVSHVVGMIARVEEGRDPKIFVQSPTLDLLFERRESIITDINVVDDGIVVVQTSDDPEVVAALQTHAAEVSDMADRGMQAVHEMMMQRPTN